MWQFLNVMLAVKFNTMQQASRGETLVGFGQDLPSLCSTNMG